MKRKALEENLMAEMEEMEIIDCHEHLPPEKQRTSSPQDVFTLVSTYYVKCDLLSAGMDQSACESLLDHAIPLEQRWRSFKPYWQAVRHGSYARAALLAAKMVYGFNDINDQTYQDLSETIAAENSPGIYKRILCDQCRIRLALNQSEETDLDRPLVPVMPAFVFVDVCEIAQVEALADKIGQPMPKTLEDYLSIVRMYMEKWAEDGAVGIKLFLKYNFPPNHAKAEEGFKHLSRGYVEAGHDGGLSELGNYLLHYVVDLAAELDLTIGIHAGIWGDFRLSDSKFLLTLAPAHPQARFDLFHLGMPFVRDTIVISKNLPNVFLNLCWTHIISPSQTCSAIDELLDQVPVNKVLAFGGDYDRPVEKVVGHLHIAKEDFARVFASRINRGLLSFDEAMEVLSLWFWHNPLALYRRAKI